MPVLAIVSLLVAGPAVANGFHLQPGPSPLPNYGYGAADGTITWTGKFHFDWNGSEQDICPADGLGVSFYFDLSLGDGTELPGNPVASDTDGCNNETYGSGAGTVTKQREIVQARVVTCWTKDGNLCWAVPLNGIGAWKNNPNT